MARRATSAARGNGAGVAALDAEESTAMSRSGSSKRIGRLLQQGRWAAARAALEKERINDPSNHWLLTQLGVTYYEQRKYKEALKFFRKSLTIMPDCPLTLWNLAGGLDAMGKPLQAMAIYTSLLKSTTSPGDDPCWESNEWADSLKVDCVFRLGVCFEHLENVEKAEHCYQQYLQLALVGVEGTYSVEAVTARIRGLHMAVANGAETSKEVQAAVKAVLSTTTGKSQKRRSRTSLN